MLLFAAGLAAAGCVTNTPPVSASSESAATHGAQPGSGSDAASPGGTATGSDAIPGGGTAQPNPLLVAVPAGGAGSAAASTLPPPAQTQAERRAVIERQLDDSIGTFDSTLKKERERLARERDAHAVAADPAADAVVKRDPGPRPRAGAVEIEGDEPGAGGSRGGDLKSSASDSGTNSGGSSGNGASAREIPDGSDDDIVARRLRKAAEQETDPELKEKLWKEYVEYKKSGQTR